MNKQLIFHLKHHEMPITMTAIQWARVVHFGLHFYCISRYFFFSYCCCMGDKAVIVIPTANICRMDIIKCRLCGIFYVADPIKFIQI